MENIHIMNIRGNNRQKKKRDFLKRNQTDSIEMNTKVTEVKSSLDPSSQDGVTNTRFTLLPDTITKKAKHIRQQFSWMALEVRL